MSFQNIIGTKLGQAAITTSYLSVYNTPNDTRTYVKDISICNTTSSSINIYVHFVASNTTVGTANALFYNTALPGGTTVQWTGSQILNAGETIQVKASATGCTVNVTGGEAV